MRPEQLLESVRNLLAQRALAEPYTPLVLMVSGGSDSTALAYVAAELVAADEVGPLAMLHVNHCLRGDDSNGDARFVADLAHVLDIPLFTCEIDIARLVCEERGNMEAIARRERYAAAYEALQSHCAYWRFPLETGRIAVAHTADDRIENFYMRSIVGTGPGGFRSMRYENGQVIRPLLDVERADLRAFIEARAEAGAPVARDGQGALWREDATNADTDHLRNYVRHAIVPAAREKNPRLTETLVRTMNLIADEDDLLQAVAEREVDELVSWIEPDEARLGDFSAGCVLASRIAFEDVAIYRRVCFAVLGLMLGDDARVEAASVEAVLAACDGGRLQSGYVANIQGDLAVSANKRGVRIEPMAAFRARRKRK